MHSTMLPKTLTLIILAVAVLSPATIQNCSCVTLPPVEDFVTQEFFDGIINQSHEWCPGRNFYTRDAFIEATKFYPAFPTQMTLDAYVREIAALFAHFTHDTGHFCIIEEIDGPSMNYCNSSYTDYPCESGEGYYGRGPLPLRWNYNYGEAGKRLELDLLTHPHLVTDKALSSFNASLWLWMEKAHPVITQGFGETIRALYSIECGGGNTPAVSARIKHYKDYCNEFRVPHESNPIC